MTATATPPAGTPATSAVVPATQSVDPVIAEAQATKSRLALVKAVLAPDLTDQEMMLFALVANRLRLDPFVRQIHAVKRSGKLTFQTGIDGFRGSAEETDEYRGTTEPEFGPVPEDAKFPHPEWARVGVIRQRPGEEERTQYARVEWDEYYPGDGADGWMWRKMPRNQLAKCAEAAAFRRAFPQRFSGLYAPEEMEQDRVEQARPVGPETARGRAAARRAEIESANGSRDVDSRSAGDDVAEVVAGAAAATGRQTEPEADPHTVPGSVDADGVIEGEVLEVQTTGLSSGELRERLRQRKVAIPFAMAEARQRFGDVENLDALTDAQRLELWTVVSA